MIEFLQSDNFVVIFLQKRFPMKNNSIFLRFIKEKSKVIVAWVVVFLFFFLSFWAGWLVSFSHALLLTVCLMFASDVESKYIVKFLQKGNIFLFYIINVFFVILMSAITTYLEGIMFNIMSKYLSISISLLDGAKELIFPFLIRMVLFTAASAISVITVLQRAERENQRIKNEIKSERLDMELRFLKSQITPHFLFNALNNIYSLVYTKDENAPQSVLKLSDMLRYVIVDCQVDLISLDKEIKYIDAYLDLQQMIMENKSNVIFEKNIKNNNFMIPPMILQPLVENSFKHSRIVNDPNGFVHFHIIQEDNDLVFIARNSIKSTSVSIVDGSKKEKAGIGLKNVKKRLELYYEDRFSFDTKHEDNCYTATIKIGDSLNEKKV